MHCKACDTLLSDTDLKRKDKLTGDFLDLCPLCAHASHEAIYYESFVTGVDNDPEDALDYKEN